MDTTLANIFRILMDWDGTLQGAGSDSPRYLLFEGHRVDGVTVDELYSEDPRTAGLEQGCPPARDAGAVGWPR